MSMLPGVAAGHGRPPERARRSCTSGGSAADAGVAMMLVSCAAETIFTGLSGGGFAIHYDAGLADGDVSGLLRPDSGHHRPCARAGVAHRGGLRRPAGAVRHRARRPLPCPGCRPAPNGSGSVGAGWTGAEVVAPGLAASYGTPFPQAHADLLPMVSQAMHVGDGDWVYRRPDGTFLQAGDVLVHTDQHLAYRLLADDPDAFYRGAYAQAMLGALADGSSMDLADLETYEVVESEPRVIPLRGTQVASRGNDLDDLLGTLAADGAGGADVRHDPDAGTRPGPGAAATGPAGRDHQLRGRRCRRKRVRDHDHPRVGLGRLGAGVRRTPQLDARRR